VVVLGFRFCMVMFTAGCTIHVLPVVLLAVVLDREIREGVVSGFKFGS